MGMLELFFGKGKKCKGRRVKGRKSRKISKSAKVMVNGRKRKVYKGCNGGLYYKRTKNGKTYRVYIKSKRLSKRRGGSRFGRRGVRRGTRLKQTKAARDARRRYRKARKCAKKGMRLRRGRCTRK
jgi:hypothetical protein